jgi:hypothetical protein
MTWLNVFSRSATIRCRSPFPGMSNEVRLARVHRKIRGLGDLAAAAGTYLRTHVSVERDGVNAK